MVWHIVSTNYPLYESASRLLRTENNASLVCAFMDQSDVASACFIHKRQYARAKSALALRSETL